MDNDKVFTSFPLLTSNTSYERSHSQHRLAATITAGFSASQGTLSPCPLTSQCSVCSDWVLSELSCPLAAHGPLYQLVAVRPESLKEFPPPLKATAKHRQHPFNEKTSCVTGRLTAAEWPRHCEPAGYIWGVHSLQPLRGKLVNTVQPQNTGRSLWHYIVFHVFTRQLKCYVTFGFPLLQSTQNFITL